MPIVYAEKGNNKKSFVVSTSKLDRLIDVLLKHLYKLIHITG